MVESNFMRLEHKGIWEIVNTPEEAINALGKRKNDEDWRKIAKI